MSTQDAGGPAIDTTVARPARVYDYWLGGKDNFQHPDQGAAVTQRLNARTGPAQLTMRTRAEILAYFDGLDLAEPGLVSLPYWRPRADPPGLLNANAGVARKP